METTLHIAFTWLHILGIALWVGPQVMLAVAWPAASRQVTDLPQRVAAMRVMTRRFGYLGGAGLALIVIAGTYLISTWREYYAIPEDADFLSLRFGFWFVVKMTLFLLMLAVVGLHIAWAGPRQLRAYEAKARGEGDDEELRAARRLSLALSISGLALSLAIMVMGTMIGTSGWSLQER
ncbi:hypothetical protein [Tepidiforma sp.]|uniref:hypothetical protein n=1 Tax=Tepidiforma sp. TaxID=2682230 RepID=UPI002ADE1730|nr:hypothetical protein [Tepidiforma sp.]